MGFPVFIRTGYINIFAPVYFLKSYVLGRFWPYERPQVGIVKQERVSIVSSIPHCQREQY